MKKQNPLLYMKVLALHTMKRSISIDFKTQYFHTNSILGSSLKTNKQKDHKEFLNNTQSCYC